MESKWHPPKASDARRFGFLLGICRGLVEQQGGSLCECHSCETRGVIWDDSVYREEYWRDCVACGGFGYIVEFNGQAFIPK